MNELFSLKGKIGVVTGGAGLLGIQHARALLQLGSTVQLWDIDETATKNAISVLNREFPSAQITFQCIDITNPPEVERCATSAIKEYSKIDVLINNAALNPKFDYPGQKESHRFETYSVDVWNQELAVGLTGAMLCAKVIGTHMSSNGGGVILNIASDLSVIAPDQRIYENSELDPENQFKKPISYSVIKTGLVGMTRYLATYWADKDVRVNALSPGGVLDAQSEDFVLKLTERIPMKRMALADEYVGAVQFLCSDASKYMTGQNIVIDGGRSVW